MRADLGRRPRGLRVRVPAPVAGRGVLGPGLVGAALARLRQQRREPTTGLVRAGRGVGFVARALVAKPSWRSSESFESSAVF